VPASEAHRLSSPPQVSGSRQAEERLHATESRVCARQWTLCIGGRRITIVKNTFTLGNVDNNLFICRK